MKLTGIPTILALLAAVSAADAFSPKTDFKSCSRFSTSVNMANQEKKGGLFQGFFDNLDNVVDDFVYKRMGAGEQWYGKRKSNPSGKFDGDYQGMGQSDQFRIELARVQKEEMEKRRLRRLAEEEEARRTK